MFKSIPDYRKIVLLIFSIKKDENILQECGFLKSDVIRLCLEFENFLMEQNQEYLEKIKKEEESMMILNKKMEAYFSKLFEDVRHERSLNFLLSLTELDIIKQ